jgi:Protein of unknown function (DUF2281)
MNTAELIYQKSQKLPEPIINEVLDFIDFLEYKYLKNKQPSVSNTEADIKAHLQASMAKNRRLGELLAK